MIQFDARDLNPWWISRAEEEARAIYGSSRARGERSESVVVSDTLRGHGAEAFCIQVLGMSDDDRKYRDVLSSVHDHEPVEIKVTKPHLIRSKVKHCSDIRRHKSPDGDNIYRDFYPDLLMIFLNNGDNSLYTLDYVYRWSEDRQYFVKSRKDNELIDRRSPISL